MIRLAEGSGGKEMQDLIKGFRKILRHTGEWENISNDSATYNLGDYHLVFTTDSFIVDPLFFPGGDIGKIAVCGTINDLAVMGAQPLGLSLSFVLEEGFSKDSLNKIIESMNAISMETGIPIVTGDTKVAEKGKIDKIVINTAGIGLCKVILNKKLEAGDKIIVSGSIGDHTIALLSKRFDFETNVVSDSKSVSFEMNAVNEFIKMAKDPTRGGLAATLNELSEDNKMQFYVYEENIPLKREVKAVEELLGLDFYQFACEGRFICICSSENSGHVLETLRKFNPDANIIGEVRAGSGVVIKTRLGERILHNPTGNIIPRIC
ncbi:MAG: hydrogenase expression/formation protein HypE [Nanoarchaeota archaeon]|nr:hydrogenase expression/formation protein HypE [Nanoarchaeota archaeon]